MLTLKQRKYKDAMPKDTLYIIRHILNEMGIIPIETGWNHTVDNYYSLRIIIEGTNIGVNGKGTTHEYALASAYAELIERLQNMTQYRLSVDLSPNAHEHKGFYYSPDEQARSIYELIYSEEEWMRTQRKMISSQNDIYKLLRKWQQMSYEQIPYDFITIPYMNLNTKKLSYIPIKMVSKMYMSNGMSSGNTYAEAVVQGICEVLERYINKKILTDKITPPTYPKAYLEKYPRIITMIQAIEKHGDKKVIVKDCSLGKGYPVTAVIYIDKKEGAYYVKFGSHPIFELSVERTLTELLQGQNIGRMIGLTPFESMNKNSNNSSNILNILINGVGSYPKELFEENNSYSWQPFKWKDQESNMDLLKALVAFIEEKGVHTYVRDVSFLKFPSFHVIIPGLSEVESMDDEKALDHYIQYNTAKRILRAYGMGSVEDKKKYLNLLEKSQYFFSDISALMHSKPIKNAPWYLSDMGLFITAAYYQLNMYKKSYESFLKWFNHAIGKREVLSNRVYYRCVLNYLYLKSEEKEHEYIYKTLNSFFTSEVVERVLREFNANIFLNDNLMSCWNCEACRYKGDCTYQEEERIYKILKRKAAINPISQEDLKHLIG